MKSLFLILYLLNTQIQNNQTIASSDAVMAKGLQLKIMFSNHTDNYTHIDSVWVVLDRFDHTGAGIIRKKFYAGADHSVIITGVPEGKYYATIQFLGFHKDKIEQIVRVERKQVNTCKLKLKDCEEYSKDKVELPGEKIDLAKLSIVEGR